MDATQPDATGGVQIQEQQPSGQSPTVITPVPHTGLRGFIDKALDSLGGKTKIQPYQDQDGNIYIQHPNKTRGEQWMQIASEALRGAGAGLAAGKGAGNGGRALEAGIQAGDQLSQQQQDQVQQKMLQMANSQALKHNIAAQSFALTRQQVKASQEDTTFYDGQADRMTKEGGTLLGTVRDVGQIADMMRDTPGFKEAQVQQNRVVPVPNVLPDGTHDGFKVFMMPAGYNDKLTQPGSVFHTFDPIKGQLVPHQTTAWTPQGQIDTYDHLATSQQLDYQQKQAELENKKADTTAKGATTKETEAKTGAIPTETALKKAQTGEAVANTGKAVAETGKAEAETAETQALTGGGAGGGMIDEIGTGKMDAGRLSYLMARKPEILEAVAKKYPDFDSSKVHAYVNAYKDFTSGKTSIALNSGGTALGHLAELQALNTPMSHIPHTSAWTAYQNKVDTVASELAKFYGDATIPAIASIKNTLSSTLPGNRQAAIQTQAQSMGDKLDSFKKTWTNAAPSKAYEAAMPDISEAAKDARAKLDPKYAVQRVQELQNMPPAQQAQQAPGGAPPGATSEVHQGGATGPLIGHIVDGKYVPLTAPPSGMTQ